MIMIKVLCCGGRDYSNNVKVDEVMDWYRSHFGFFMLIEGGAKGADRLCRLWAQAKGLPVVTIEANWNFYGRRAGGVRNKWMADLKPDVVVAFPGAVGTASMVRIAREEGIEVQEVA